MKKLIALCATLAISICMMAQTNLYLIGENSLTNGWSNSNTAGKMTYDATNKVYTVTATLTGYFAFTTNLGNDWDQLNANRYGPSSDGSVPAVGTTTALSKANTSFNATSIAGEYKITVSLENNTYLLESVGDYTPTYTVVGSAAACNGLNWGDAFEVTTNDMTLVSGTTYQLVVTGCTLEVGTTYEYKIAKDKGWKTCWPASNKQFSVSETAVYTITYTFNSSTNAVSETTTKTGEAGAITHTYNVAGAILLPTDELEASGKFLDGVSLWDAAANQMTTTDDVNYTLTFTNVEIESGSTILFKICQDGAWSVSYGWGDEEGSVGTNNAWLYINYSGIYTVTFTFNAETHIVAAAATRTGSASPITVKFQKPDTWAKAYLYAWNKNDKLEWPGEEMTVDGNWMKFIINSGDSIIFNNGLENDALIQSADIPNVTADACYLWQDNDAVLDEDCDGMIPVYYTIVGDLSVVNGEAGWATMETANDMTLKSGTTYELVVTDKVLETGKTYNFKVIKNHDYANGEWPAENKTFSVDETAIYTITYTFNTATGEVGVSTKKTGEAGEITHTYTVAGTAAIVNGDVEWDATNTDNDMTLDTESGLYVLTVTGLELQASSEDNIYAFKVVVDHNWSYDSYPEGSGNDWILNIAEAGTYKIVYTFNAETKDITATATRTDIVSTESFAIAGTHEILNGDADWADAANNNLLTLNDVTNLYTLTITGAILEKDHQYEYQVVKVVEGEIKEWLSGSNQILTVGETAEYTIVYTYNATANVVTYQLTKTGEAGEITHTYYLAGNTGSVQAGAEDPVFNTAWTPNLYQMTTSDDVNYTFIVEDFKTDTAVIIYFKVCQDGGWGTTYGWDEEANPGSGNAWLWMEAGTYNITFSFAPSTRVLAAQAIRTDAEDDRYVVAGSKQIVNGDADWATAEEANLMTLDEGTGLYTLTITEATLENGVTYEYKVVKNGTNYIPDGVGNNRTITVDETAVYTIVYTFDVATEEITHTLTKTGEAGVITHTYTIAGAAAIVNGSEWEPTNTDNDMILDDATGLYTLVVTNCELQVSSNENIYGFKVVVDHSWGVAYPSSDWIINVTEAGTYDITYTFNEATKDINAVLSKKDTPTSVETIALDPNQPMYNILGIEVGKNYRGIVIQNGQKFLR